MSPGAMSVSTPAPSDITQRRLGHCVQAGVHTHMCVCICTCAVVHGLSAAVQSAAGSGKHGSQAEGHTYSTVGGATARVHSSWQVPAPYLVQQSWWGIPDRGKSDPGPVGLCHGARVHNWHAPLLQQLDIQRLVGPLCAQTQSVLSVACAGCCWHGMEWERRSPFSHGVLLLLQPLLHARV